MKARWILSAGDQEDKELLTISKHPIWWLVVTLCFPHVATTGGASWSPNGGPRAEMVLVKTKIKGKPTRAEYHTTDIL